MLWKTASQLDSELFIICAAKQLFGIVEIHSLDLVDRIYDNELMSKYQSDSSNFFNMLLPVAALIVTSFLVLQQTDILSRARTPKIHTYTYELQEGYNPLVLPLETGLTMQDVCHQLDLDELLRWDNTHSVIGLRTYDCSDPVLKDTIANRIITVNDGLIIKLENARSWVIQGSKASVGYDLSKPATYMYGFPQSEKRALYAQDVCRSSKSPDLTISEVYSMNSDGSYETHVCTEKVVNNFSVDYGIGYFFFVTATDGRGGELRNLPTDFVSK